MKHLTFADKSLLTGSEVSDLLLEYAALLAKSADADTVSLAAIGPDGNNVTATVLLNAGTPLMAESADSQLGEPDNSIVEQYLREQISMHRDPPSVVVPDPVAGDEGWDQEYEH